MYLPSRSMSARTTARASSAWKAKTAARLDRIDASKSAVVQLSRRIQMTFGGRP